MNNVKVCCEKINFLPTSQRQAKYKHITFKNNSKQNAFINKFCKTIELGQKIHKFFLSKYITICPKRYICLFYYTYKKTKVGNHFMEIPFDLKLPYCK